MFQQGDTPEPEPEVRGQELCGEMFCGPDAGPVLFGGKQPEH